MLFNSSLYDKDKNNGLYIWQDSGQWDLLANENFNLTPNLSDIITNIFTLDLTSYNCIKVICSTESWSFYISDFFYGSGFGPKFILNHKNQNTIVKNLLDQGNMIGSSSAGTVNCSARKTYSYIYKVGDNYISISNSGSDVFIPSLQPLLTSQDETLTIDDQKFYKNDELVIAHSFTINDRMRSVTNCNTSIQIYGQK